MRARRPRPRRRPDLNSEFAAAPRAVPSPETDPAARSAALLQTILDQLDADQAEETIVIDLKDKSDMADAMVIASGRSQRHVGAISDKVLRVLKERGFGSARVEGMPACDWVLIDAGDVILHVFRPEVRAFYNLERIWSPEALSEPVSSARRS